MVTRHAQFLFVFVLGVVTVACLPSAETDTDDAGDTLPDSDSETVSESETESDTATNSGSDTDTETITDTGFDTNVDTSCDGVVQIPDPYFEFVIRNVIEKPTGDLTGEDLATITDLLLGGCDMGNLAEKKVVQLIGAQCLSSLQNFGGECLDIDGLHWLTDLPTLRSFALLYSYYSEPELATAQQLGSLMLVGTPIHLESLAEMTHLGNLSASSSISESDLAPLAGLTELQSLDLSGCGAPDESLDFSSLGGLTELQSLNISWTSTTTLPPASALTNLVALDISNTEVSDLIPLMGATKLKTLNAENSDVVSVVPLVGCVQLVDVNVGGTPVVDLDGLESLSALKRLSFEYNAVTDLTPIAGLENIVTVRGIHSDVEDLAPLEMVNWQNLDSLDINYALVTDLSPLVTNTTTFHDQVTVLLWGNPLDCAAQASNITALRDRGVKLYCDCGGCL